MRSIYLLTFLAAGAPVHGHVEQSVYHYQCVTNQPMPDVFADQGYGGPGPQSGGDASQLVATAQTVSPTLSNAVAVPSCDPVSEPMSVDEAAAGLAVASETAAELSDRPLANMKEKTPMCLINELARFNKVNLPPAHT